MASEADRRWMKGKLDDRDKNKAPIKIRASSGKSLINERIKQLNVDTEDVPKPTLNGRRQNEAFRKNSQTFKVGLSSSSTFQKRQTHISNPTKNVNKPVSQASFLLSQKIAKAMTKDQKESPRTSPIPFKVNISRNSFQNKEDIHQKLGFNKKNDVQPRTAPLYSTSSSPKNDRFQDSSKSNVKLDKLQSNEKSENTLSVTAEKDLKQEVHIDHALKKIDSTNLTPDKITNTDSTIKETKSHARFKYDGNSFRSRETLSRSESVFKLPRLEQKEGAIHSTAAKIESVDDKITIKLYDINNDSNSDNEQHKNGQIDRMKNDLSNAEIANENQQITDYQIECSTDDQHEQHSKSVTDAQNVPVKLIIETSPITLNDENYDNTTSKENISRYRDCVKLNLYEASKDNIIVEAITVLSEHSSYSEYPVIVDRYQDVTRNVNPSPLSPRPYDYNNQVNEKIITNIEKQKSDLANSSSNLENLKINDIFEEKRLGLTEIEINSIIESDNDDQIETGVNNSNATIHAEKHRINQDKSSERIKSRNVNSTTTVVVDDLVINFNQNSHSSEAHTDNSKGPEEEGDYKIPISGKISEPECKYASNKQATVRMKNNNRDNYLTSSGSENDQDLNINNNTQVYSDNTDSSNTCEAKHEGGKARRRKLTKRRSKNIIQNRNSYTSSTTNDKQTISDSDNDFLRSDPIDDSKFHKNKKENYKCLDKEIFPDSRSSGLKKSTLPLSNNTIINTDKNVSLIEKSEGRLNETHKSQVASATFRYGENIMSSTIDMLKRDSVSQGTLPQSNTEPRRHSQTDNLSKLDSWRFPSISRVSTHKLISFPSSPHNGKGGYSSDATSSFTDISHQHEKQISIVSPSSDGEHEMTSRLETLHKSRLDGDNLISLSNNSHRLNAFKLPNKQISQEDAKAANEARDALNNLPSSPFSLLWRFTDDTQKMQNPVRTEIQKDSIDRNSSDTSSEVLIAPPHNFQDRDNISNKKIVSRLPVSVSAIKNKPAENHKSRSLYVESGTSEIDFELPTVVPPPPVSEEVMEATEVTSIVSKRHGKHPRPKLPFAMLKSPEYNADPYIPKDENGSNSDDVHLELNKKAGPFSKRVKRPTVAQSPHLERIQEDEGLKRNAFREESIEEVRFSEAVGENKLDDQENGYSSLSEPQTPKDLSYEDLPSVIEYDQNFDSDQTVVRSKSDPMPAGLSEGETVLIDATINKHKKNNSCKSEHSITNNIKEPDRGSTTSLESTGKIRAASATSNDDSGLETPSTTPVLPVTPTEDVSPSPVKKTPKTEMRKHVLNNLLDTEKSYVQNLSIMVKTFLEPLKKPDNSNTVDSSQVDEIFYQIPEILSSHEMFLEQLQKKVYAWSDEQIIGDIFVDSFTNCYLMDSYSNFITHFPQANEAIRNATNARPQFQKFIEQCSKEHKEKLTLPDLLIMPVQRIPRYELILREFLKYTSNDHPDYDNLQVALGEIKTLASRMNKGELDAHQAEKDVDRLRDIEATIEGITELVTGTRKFIRQDLVAEVTNAVVKKDRCLFLFSDLLVCTTVRKKTHALRRGSLGLFTGQSAAELNRYKFLWELPLEDFEILKTHAPQSKSGTKEMDSLEKDIKLLEGLSVSVRQLEMDHLRLENLIREMREELITKIKEIQNAPSPTATLSPPQTRIDIHTQKEDGPVNYTFLFLSAECKSSWEAYFEDAKQKLAYSRDSLSPEFQYLMPILKTRSGMQFTCAAPSHVSGQMLKPRSPTSSCDVWVCNSDGYVGQVCLLALVPEAEPKASLSVCSAKIVCIAAVPGGRIISMKQGNVENNSSSKLNVLGDNISLGKFNNKKSSKISGLNPSKHKKSFELDEEDNVASIIAFDSSDEDDTGIDSPYMAKT